MTDKFTSVYDVLHHIQQNIKAPKTQHNKHGGYDYRSCEDIVEAAKPLLPTGAILRLEDDIIVVPVEENLEYTKIDPLTNGASSLTDNRKSDGRVYVKATASLYFNGAELKNAGFAREPASQKGATPSQITGMASSYARKYALSGLFMLDDVKDDDKKAKPKSDEWAGDTAKTEKEEKDQQAANALGGSMTDAIDADTAKQMYEQALAKLNNADSLADLQKNWKATYKSERVFTTVFTKEQQDDLTAAKDRRKEELDNKAQF